MGRVLQSAAGQLLGFGASAPGLAVLSACGSFMVLGSPGSQLLGFCSAFFGAEEVGQKKMILCS